MRIYLANSIDIRRHFDALKACARKCAAPVIRSQKTRIRANFGIGLDIGKAFQNLKHQLGVDRLIDIGAQAFADYKDFVVKVRSKMPDVPIVFISLSPAPVRWDELPDIEMEYFTIATMPARFAQLGDLHDGIDEAVCDLRVLLEWVEREDAEGAGEAPYPPNFPKMPGEPKRVQPSRAKKG